MPLGIIAGFIIQYRYVALMLGVLVADPWVPLLSGVLVRAGVFTFFGAYAAIMVGALVGDAIWYWIGYHYGEGFLRRFGKYFSITPDHVEFTKKLFHRYHTRILLLSKLSMGLGFSIVILFTSGMSRISFRRFMLLNLVGQFFWSGALMGIGFLFGHLYLVVNNALERVFIIAMCVLGLLALFGLSRYVRGRIMTRYAESS